MAESVLFTCVGTTDTVRGLRDGGMMHAMRHYRPQKVYIFVSSEMEMLNQRDRRYEKTFRFIQEKWGGYAPKVQYNLSGIVDADDLDQVAQPMSDFFEQVVRENPEAQILINLSSGTPQMKMILAQLALNNRYNDRDIVGVQVRNPDKRSGDSDRTNKKNYSVEEELELNEDEEPDAPNRCSEPKLFAIQRDRVSAQMRSLLARRDYRALEAIGDQLPPEVLPLIRHLAVRNDLQTEEAYKLARTLNLPFKLYPVKHAAGSEYRELSEYYLLLRNLQLTGRYSEFVLRINPFLTHLMARQMEISLPEETRGTIERCPNGRIKFHPEVLRRKQPDVAAELERRCGIYLNDGDLSLFVGVPLLRILGKLPEHVLCTLEACENLNSEQRNQAAHQLHAVTNEDIRRVCVDGNRKVYGADELVRIFAGMLENAYPEVCDRALFTIYDRCGDYISKRL